MADAASPAPPPHKHDPGGGVEHRRACQQLVATSWAISPLSLTRVTIIAAAGRAAGTGSAPPARRRWSSAHLLEGGVGAQVVFEDADTDAAIRLIARIIIPAMASPRTNFVPRPSRRRNRPRWQHLYAGFRLRLVDQPSVKIGVNRHLFTGIASKVKRAETSEIRSAPLGRR